MNNLPILFKKTNTGALQYWEVLVEPRDGFWAVVTNYGQVGTDSPQTTYDLVKEGKNLGKKNATTAETQAYEQARQLHEKKIKQGYIADKALASNTDNALDGIKPMLAHVFEDHQAKVKFPALVQPKLDGMRCIAVIKNGNVKLFSRTQKPINTVPHIVKFLEEAFVGQNLVLDGELYNHEFKKDFDSLISILKRDSLHPEHTKAQYHIYDMPSAVGGFDDRFKELHDLPTNTVKSFDHANWPVRIVETVQANDMDHLSQIMSEFIELGYEGAMYRNPDSPYEGKRSSGLLKMKTFKDEEFKIVDVEEGSGKLMGKAGAIWCVTNDPESRKPFKAKMKGSLDSLTDYLINKQKYIGRMLTVKYQDYTPDGIPRFPVGMRVREEE